MNSPAPAITVIVVTYNSREHLALCVSALERQTWRAFEVIVFDNASDDGGLDTVDPPDARFRFIRSDENLGFAGANNRAAAEARAPWIVTLNPDAFPEPDWLAELMAAAQRYPEVDMFGSTQLLADNLSLLDGAGDVYHASGMHWRGLHRKARELLPSEGEVFSPCAAAAMYRRSTFCNFGGFDEHFFCFSEDVDLAFRIRLGGGRCIQVVDAVVHHIGSGSTGRRSAFATYYGTRNRVWTYVKNMPRPLFWTLLPMHLVAEIGALALAVGRGSGTAARKGLADAVLGIRPVWRLRRKLQRRRRASTWRIARSMSWSLPALFTRPARVVPAGPSRSRKQRDARPSALKTACAKRESAETLHD